MKTSKQIGQLAEQYLNIRLPKNGNNGYIDVYVKGYTQCQKDMADTIKKAIKYGYELRNNNKPINSGIDWVKEFESLNKQD